jgi:hypothetical protein
MLSSRIPSVKDACFQHKVLTKIHGKPTHKSLQNISTELKDNASSVPSTLGGGQNGHLGLLLSAARCDTLAHALSAARCNALAHSIPWITPVNPGVFVPPNLGTGPQIAAASDVWCKLKLQFELCQAADKALIAQLAEWTDPVCLRAMLNRATGQCSGSIRAVVLHLFSAHGKITPQRVKAKEMELHQMHWDISQPVDTVFNSIDDPSDVSENANSPMTEQQMVNLAHVIFAKQSILQPDIGTPEGPTNVFHV